MNTEGLKWNNVTKQWETYFPTLATYNNETKAFVLPFTTKAEYLAWRTEWRATYRELSQAVSEYKQAYRRSTSANALRANQLNGGQSLEMTDTDLIELEQTLAKAGARLNKATFNMPYRSKEFARHLLELRKLSKLESERQYQAGLLLLNK